MKKPPTDAIEEAARIQRARPGAWDQQRVPRDANVQDDVVTCLRLPDANGVFFPSFSEKPEGVGGASITSISLAVPGLASLGYGVATRDALSIVLGVGFIGAAIFFVTSAVRARARPEPIYQNGFYVVPDALILVRSADATVCAREDIAGFSQQTSGKSPKTLVTMPGDVAHVVDHRWCRPFLESWRANGVWPEEL